MYKKAYSNKRKFALDKIEKVMQLENYVDIPAKNIAMEIILKNTKQPMVLQFMIFGSAQFLVPFLVTYYQDKPFFINEYHQWVFWLQFPSQMMFQFALFMLFNSMNVILYQKYNYSQTLTTMLKNEMRSYYKLPNEMPQLNIHNP